MGGNVRPGARSAIRDWASARPGWHLLVAAIPTNRVGEVPVRAAGVRRGRDPPAPRRSRGGLEMSDTPREVPLERQSALPEAVEQLRGTTPRPRGSGGARGRPTSSMRPGRSSSPRLMRKGFSPPAARRRTSQGGRGWTTPLASASEYAIKGLLAPVREAKERRAPL